MTLVQGLPLGHLLGACDREVLSSMALYHKVLSPLAHQISFDGEGDPSWRRWAASVDLSSTRDSRSIHHTLGKTLGLLQGVVSSPVVLKGPSLSFGKVRDIGDADILIDQDSLLPALSALEAAGYQYQGYNRNMFIRKGEYRDWKRLLQWSNQFEFSDPETGTLVELHTAFFESGRVYSEDLSALRASLGEFVGRSALDPQTGFRFLALEDRLLLLALHAGIKRCAHKKEFILRHLFDLEGLISAGIDWGTLVSRAEALSVLHHVFYLLLLQQQLLPRSAQTDWIEKIQSRLTPGVISTVHLHLACMKGLMAYDDLAIFRYRWQSPFVFKGTTMAKVRALFILPLLVPPTYEMVVIYHLAPRSPWAYFFYLLEPLRLVCRAWRHLRKTLAKAQ